MALIYNAQLNPSKIELLRDWVPTQSWLGSCDASSLDAVDAYRFDDPDGEVGIETHLLRTADGRILQVPLTYRAAPLDGAESYLIRTMDHSVLGERWVYDGCGDPVYAAALATAVVTGGSGAALEFDDPAKERPVTAHVSGSGHHDAALPAVNEISCVVDGTDTVVTAGALTLTVVRVVDVDRRSEELTLTGTWSDQPNPVLLASAVAR